MPPGQTGRAARDKARTRQRALVAVVSLAVVLILARLLIAPIQRAYAHQQTLSYLEQVMADDPLFHTIRQANPSEYAGMWSDLSATLKKDVKPEDARKIVRAYAGKVTQQRLRHASADTLRRMAALRVEMIQSLMAESPVACYEFLKTSDITGYHADMLKGYTEKLGGLLAVPTSPTPIPQDDVTARKRSDAILSRLTADELAALQYSDKPWTDHNDLCHAILKIYKAALALPDVECAQALRYLELFPTDDRNTL